MVKRLDHSNLLAMGVRSLSQKRIDRKRNLTHGSRQKELVVLELLKQPGSGEIDADGAADHVESRHGFEG
jgi:hypothetical protein